MLAARLQHCAILCWHRRARSDMRGEPVRGRVFVSRQFGFTTGSSENKNTQQDYKSRRV